jgi:hypothetical protein
MEYQAILRIVNKKAYDNIDPFYPQGHQINLKGK